MIIFLPAQTALQDLIHEYWIWKDIESNNLPWILPSYEIELVIHLGDPISIETQNGETLLLDTIHWVGPQTRRWRVIPSQNLNIFSIRFQPGAVYELFGIEAEKMTNLFPKLEESSIDFFVKIQDTYKTIFSKYEATLNYTSVKSNILKKDMEYNVKIFETVLQKIDAMFLRQMEKLNEIPAYLKFAISGFHNGQTKISELAKSLNISRKQLDRKFKSIYGLTPKDFRRIHRILQMIQNPENYNKKKFLDMMQEFGYSDQSHLIHDFKNLSGSRPSDWFINYDKMSHFYNTKNPICDNLEEKKKR